ncbi:hypothetical protein OG900_01705 [Streptomyces sp. NBC_00433]
MGTPESDSRSLDPHEMVQVAIVIKDVASAVVAVASGVKGVRSILDHLRRREAGQNVDVAVLVNGRRRTWSAPSGALTEEMVDEITAALRAGQPVADEHAPPPTQTP